MRTATKYIPRILYLHEFETAVHYWSFLVVKDCGELFSQRRFSSARYLSFLFMFLVIFLAFVIAYTVAWLLQAAQFPWSDWGF